MVSAGAKNPVGVRRGQTFATVKPAKRVVLVSGDVVIFDMYRSPPEIAFELRMVPVGWQPDVPLAQLYSPCLRGRVVPAAAMAAAPSPGAGTHIDDDRSAVMPAYVAMADEHGNRAASLSAVARAVGKSAAPSPSRRRGVVAGVRCAAAAAVRRRTAAAAAAAIRPAPATPSDPTTPPPPPQTPPALPPCRRASSPSRKPCW